MTGYSRSLIGLAIALAGLAGYVDALGFIVLSGQFVSFMSGNMTQMSVSISEGLWSVARVPAAVIVLFLVGIALGTVITHVTERFSIRARKVAVLSVVTTLLVVGSVFGSFGITPGAVTAMALAMGAVNSVFQRDGEVTIGVTYMTGALVKMGQRLTGALLGGPRWAWLQHFGMCAGLIVGAILGALMHRWIGVHALWPAAVVAAGLIEVAWLVSPSPSAR
ncbi:YoaK family protein [Rhodococcus sp. IEGM 1379]|uniref:YoaK family protein n=1 Tax=Rhodococcus sp. IEGM 1379 TaxID=3047086 RepID=UPI0024B75EE7|nr:YoaK family protein [Rhodococcus sp. IEGM 1379]MDI9916592.1 YoaK family protein [Rhodococcus sp. IEGM 1379]